jgi:hypothetical protein
VLKFICEFLSKGQVWMSIFHIINLKKKNNHGHRGTAFFK